MPSTASDKTASTVTRQTIASRIATTAGLKPKDAAQVVDAIIGLIRDTLAKGQEVMITGFGKFVVLDKDARVGRNPQTGTPVQIAARRVMRFRPSDGLKTQLNKDLDAS